MEDGIATAIPSAVAIKASEIAGATTASSADPILPIAVKAFIIPMTVPRTPRNGAIFEVVAKYVEIDVEEGAVSLETEDRMTALVANLPIKRTLSGEIQLKQQPSGGEEESSSE